ncbi:MAG: hypothetical protein N3E47_01195 [Candidatus Bathyarchaeota archaeon]|nr:hypothetical protein [Candidatus Bathyarchaeota archaeon]
MVVDGGKEIIEALRAVFRRALCSSLGESAGEAILFFLRVELGRDPFEVLWEEPKTLYQAMEKILGMGTRVLINALVTRVNWEYGLNMSPERFMELMRSEDQTSHREIRTLLKETAELYRK